jgi:endonuclease YncB( thermonuclease family)
VPQIQIQIRQMITRAQYAFALLAGLVLLAGVPALIQTRASPIEPGAIEVVDRDTIRTGGRTFRLVAFDTPEVRSRARCESERVLAAAAYDACPIVEPQ